MTREVKNGKVAGMLVDRQTNGQIDWQRDRQTDRNGCRNTSPPRYRGRSKNVKKRFSCIGVQDGEKVSSDATSGVIITKKIETSQLISVLVVRSSRMVDAGIYVCRSSNRDAAWINVIVINGQLVKLLCYCARNARYARLRNLDNCCTVVGTRR